MRHLLRKCRDLSLAEAGGCLVCCFHRDWHAHWALECIQDPIAAYHLALRESFIHCSALLRLQRQINRSTDNNHS